MIARVRLLVLLVLHTARTAHATAAASRVNAPTPMIWMLQNDHLKLQIEQASADGGDLRLSFLGGSTPDAPNLLTPAMSGSLWEV
jgi:hypothetical protein